MERLLLDLSINVTSMFRDPTFYVAFREKVVPLLRTYPFVRIWNAGCSTGEEVYSLAILLEEEGLYDRTRIYATDINEAVLERARRGHLPAREDAGVHAELHARRRRAGVLRVLHRRRTTARCSTARSCENVVFAQHNLVTDRSFNEFNVIVCRNVMIYFDRALQDRVHDLFHESLATFGVLALGHKETIRFTPLEHALRGARRATSSSTGRWSAWRTS